MYCTVQAARGPAGAHHYSSAWPARPTVALPPSPSSNPLPLLYFSARAAGRAASYISATHSWLPWQTAAVPIPSPHRADGQYHIAVDDRSAPRKGIRRLLSRVQDAPESSALRSPLQRQSRDCSGSQQAVRHSDPCERQPFAIHGTVPDLIPRIMAPFKRPVRRRGQGRGAKALRRTGTALHTRLIALHCRHMPGTASTFTLQTFRASNGGTPPQASQSAGQDWLQ